MHPYDPQVSGSYDSREEANMFDMMEKLPCRAIGMWLFPAEAFPERTVTICPLSTLPSTRSAISGLTMESCKAGWDNDSGV